MAERRATKKTAKKKARKKAASRKKKTAPSAGHPAAGEGVACRIRMYRQGLGDCYLLSFPRPDAGGLRHALIDCGIYRGTKIIGEILDDVREATGGRLDLLVATHEHLDHVSGFYNFKEHFKGAQARFEVGGVWLAWTEDPHDPIAREIATTKDRARTALQLAAQRSGLGADASPFGFAKTSDEGMDLVHELGEKADGPEYLRPGQTVAFPGLPNVRAYVLGPPRVPKLLTKEDPREGEGVGFAVASYASSLQRDAGDRSFPFRPALRFARDEPYDFVTRAAYDAPGAEWRRIDDDWIGFADSLALQLNTGINNTSLVLAFELVDSGRVLLFVGDAQLGNWMSWWGFDETQRADGSEEPSSPALRFAVPSGATTLDADGDGFVTLDDLLAGTVVYKVGHHGSHNGTLGRYGLDHMTHPDLVALMSAHEAHAFKANWNRAGGRHIMPHPPLVERLLELTKGRLLSSDPTRGMTPDKKPRPDRRIDAEWRRFQKRVTVGPDSEETGEPLWFEYAV